MKRVSALMAVMMALLLIFAACTPHEEKQETPPADCGLSISQSTATIDYPTRESIQLTASTTGPDEYVFQWSSSDSNVATVNPTGLVTAVGEGKTTITVACRIKGKTQALDKKTCEVTVTFPADYYAIPVQADGSRNADVIANPGKWFFYTQTTQFSSGEVFYMQDAVTVSFTGLAEGKEWYLRYQPTLAMGTAYDATMKLTLSTEAYVRFAGNVDGNTRIDHYDAGEHEITVTGRVVNDQYPFSINLLADGEDTKSFFSGDFSFTVSQFKAEPTVSISQKQATIDLNAPDQTVQLTATDPEGGEIAWTSDTPDVASVEDGLVTGHQEGTAVITATAKSGKSASCTVTVISKTVTISQTGLVLDLGGTKTATLTATASDGSDISWATSDDSIVTIDHGTVTAIAKGTATVIARSGAVFATCKVIVADTSAKTYEIKSGKNAEVVADPGIWYFFDEYSGILGANYDNGAVKINVKAGKTIMVRYQPLLPVGTTYTISFKVTLPEGVSSQTFDYNGNKNDALTGGEQTFSCEATVNGSTPFTFKIKLDGECEFTISDVTVTPVTEEA